MPTVLEVFHKFFTKRTLRKIAKETNRYAGSIDPATESTRGPSAWWRLALLTKTNNYIIYYMCLGKNPNFHIRYNPTMFN